MKKILYLCGTAKDDKAPCNPFVHNRLIRHMDNIGYSFKNICIQPIPDFFLDVMLKKLKKIKWQKKWPERTNFDGIEYAFVRSHVNLVQWRNFEKIGDVYFDSLWKKIKDFDYDLIHAHWAYPFGYMAMKISERKKIPYIVTCHGVDINILPFRNEELRRKTIEVLENSKYSVFVSEFLKNKAKEIGYSGKNSLVIHNGYDENIFKPIKNIKKNSDKKTVGFVGNLTYVKRADKFPEIFSAIAETYNNVEFLVVGEGELKDLLENELKNLNVRFTGKVSQKEVAKYMNEMDVMILPSRNEGFGCVVLEARACGIPVVASDVGGIPEALQDGGVLVDNDLVNFEQIFAEAVVKILNNTDEVKKENNLIKKFSWESISAKEIKLYSYLNEIV